MIKFRTPHKYISTNNDMFYSTTEGGLKFSNKNQKEKPFSPLHFLSKFGYIFFCYSHSVCFLVHVVCFIWNVLPCRWVFNYWNTILSACCSCWFLTFFFFSVFSIIIAHLLCVFIYLIILFSLPCTIIIISALAQV